MTRTRSFTRLGASLAAVLAMATPAFAQSGVEEIGTMSAVFQGEEIEQTMITGMSDGERMSTAEIWDMGHMTSISIYGAGLRQLTLEMTYFSAADGASAPDSVEMSWFPEGFGNHWSSEDAPEPARVHFDVLDLSSDVGRAEGSFEAVLCPQGMPGEEAPQGACAPISGTFATDLYKR